tara:strand:- start:338 stop:988 length:651 start_codon:yes stop_codon:yes gene_type:complete
MEFVSRVSALLLLITLSPILVVVSFLSLIFQGWPIFFKQERVGFKYKTFNIYKFRSMTSNSGRLITDNKDSRITNFGKFLRITKFDEIPQLLNIVKGEMRFIGPRPEVLKFFNKKKFNFLQKIKPGLSDYSSILFRNETRVLRKIGGKTPYLKLLPIKIELANYYSNRKGFLLDLRLVLYTIISIIFPKFVMTILIKPVIFSDIPKLKCFWKKYLS